MPQAWTCSVANLSSAVSWFKCDMPASVADLVNHGFVAHALAVVDEEGCCVGFDFGGDIQSNVFRRTQAFTERSGVCASQYRA